MTTRTSKAKRKAKRSSVVDEFLMGIRPWGVYVGKCHVATVLAVSREHALKVARARDLGIDETYKPQLRAKLERRRS